MGARRIARERALQALYQLEMGGGGEPEALEAAWSSEPAEAEASDPEARGFALDLVQGVRARLAELDTLIEEHSHNWRVDRMSRIDRNVLRMGVFELKH